MMKSVSIIRGAILPIALALSFATAGAAWSQPAEPAREQVYGWELMTPAEREAFQTRMRNAETPQERERIRAEHLQQMQARARAKGMDLPAEPRARSHGKEAGGYGGTRSGEGSRQGQGRGPG